MSSLSMSLIVFACVFGCTLAGMFARTRLPNEHVSADSKDVMKLAMALIATMAALVLGLLTASAQSAFSAANSAVRQGAGDAITLDRSLARYGPETNDIRARLRHLLILRIQVLWPEDVTQPEVADEHSLMIEAESIGDGIRALTPKTDSQRSLQAQAVATGEQLLAARWTTLAGSSNPIPVLFLVMLVFWLGTLFASFGLMAPRNATVFMTLLFAAIAVSGSIFLILEMGQPFKGLMKVSSAPLHFALSQLGQ
ncbi:MAG TPA: hypothetical protein PLF26_15310 [Blastocatellia bacterium]|nr:hypothetical protein [Blastocatellia bacterium]